MVTFTAAGLRPCLLAVCGKRCPGSSGLASAWHAGFDEEALSMGYEGGPVVDALVKLGQTGPVTVDGETGDDPDHLAEEVDDGGDVGELHAENGPPEIGH